MDFKGYFQDELAYISLLAQDFAGKSPYVENVFSESHADPDIAKLFESFSFLMAKNRQKIDDAFPEITHNLLERLFPLPLRPLPAAAILKLQAQYDETVYLKKGARMSIQLDTASENVIFSTTRDVTVLPLSVVQVDTEQMPEGAVLTLTLRSFGQIERDGFIQNQPLSFFLGENPALCAQLLLWFSQYLAKAEIISGAQSYWISSLCTPQSVFEQNRFTPILPVDVPQYAGLQLVSELISLPHVHDFLQLDFHKEYAAIPCDENGVFQLRFHFNRPLFTDDVLSPEHFQLNCVPILNLFEQRSLPQKLCGKRHSIALTNKKTLYALSGVSSQHRDDKGDDAQAECVTYRPITEFLPQHWADNSLPIYYQLLQTKNMLEQVEPAVVFLNANGAAIDINSDHDFTYFMRCLHPLGAGQLSKTRQFSSEEAVPNHLLFEVVTLNSASRPPNIDAKNHWQLISHLSLSSAFLADVNVIRALLIDLDIYERTHYAVHRAWRNQVNGLVKTDMRLLDWLFHGQLKRGVQLSLYFSPDHFQSAGMLYRFGCLIAQILPFCIPQSAFLKVDIINNHTQEIWSLAPVLGARPEI